MALTTLANERGAIGGDGFGGSGLLHFARLRELARTFALDADPHVRRLLVEVWIGIAIPEEWGIGRRCVDRAVRYARERVVFGRPIGEHVLGLPRSY